jgi:hypothetical protein
VASLLGVAHLQNPRSSSVQAVQKLGSLQMHLFRIDTLHSQHIRTFIKQDPTVRFRPRPLDLLMELLHLQGRTTEGATIPLRVPSIIPLPIRDPFGDSLLHVIRISRGPNMRPSLQKSQRFNNRTQLRRIARSIVIVSPSS